METRVEHRVSGQLGTLVSSGIWYSTVKFDGEEGTSWVANDSLIVDAEAQPELRG